MPPSYKLVTTISVPPKNPSSFDFAWINPVTQRYYLTDRTNTGITVVDAARDTFLTTIRGCMGVIGNPSVPGPPNSNSGPNGIEVVPSLHQAWVGDGDSGVKVIDLDGNFITAFVATGGTKRVDMVGFDPKDNIAVTVNDRDEPPFLTFISAKDLKILGKLSYPQGTHGPEQPIWNPHDSKFYLAVPATPTNPGGEIDVIDPIAMKIVDVFPLKDCFPMGIALGPNHNLVASCGANAIRGGARARTYIVDSRNGEVIETIFDVGGTDQAWFNPGDKRFYVAAAAMTSDGTKNGSPTPVLGVIDATTNKWITNVPTGNGGHSVAANPSNNHVFVAIKGSGIAVYAER